MIILDTNNTKKKKDICFYLSYLKTIGKNTKQKTKK